ncbi:hypothetical protein PUN28_006577 [Cardiocondyla obscurior]|uniref:Uncharacterized protein n=1 Tax=Cardiocondyla obscurior TaxID=286306 RepID=A0AAW2G9B6_9HYME
MIPRHKYTVNEVRFWIYFRSIERSRPSTQTDLTRAERKRRRKKEEIARGTPNRFCDTCSSLFLSRWPDPIRIHVAACVVAKLSSIDRLVCDRPRYLGTRTKSSRNPSTAARASEIAGASRTERIRDADLSIGVRRLQWRTAETRKATNGCVNVSLSDSPRRDLPPEKRVDADFSFTTAKRIRRSGNVTREAVTKRPAHAGPASALSPLKSSIRLLRQIATTLILSHGLTVTSKIQLF